MKKLLFAALLLLAALPPQDGWACLVTKASPERIDKIINEAAYLGKIEIIEEKPVKGRNGYSEKKITIKFIEPYRGGKFKESQTLSFFDGDITSCDKPSVPPGKIYEEILFKDENGKYYLSDKRDLLLDATWEDLRKQSNGSLILNERIEGCLSNGGEWLQYKVPYSPVIFDCFHLSEDFKKQCNDNSECQGKCLAKLTDEESNSFFNAMIKTAGNKDALENLDKTLQKRGECSKYTALNGCEYVVKAGYVQHRQVCH